jgi:hypothetical protein
MSWFWSRMCGEGFAALVWLLWRAVWLVALFLWLTVGIVGRMLCCLGDQRHCWPRLASIRCTFILHDVFQWVAFQARQNGKTVTRLSAGDERGGAGCHSRRASVVVAESTA